MYETSENDVLLCREVVSENPYKTRKGASTRSGMWDKIANTLNSCTKPDSPTLGLLCRDAWERTSGDNFLQGQPNICTAIKIQDNWIPK